MVRIKNRYLLVNILYPELETSHGKTQIPDLVSINQPTTDTLSAQALLKGVKAEISLLFGDYGVGAVADNLSVKYLSPATSTFILRVARAHYKIVWAALSLMHTVPVKDGKRCVFQVVRVSGTIRKAEEEAIRRARGLILRASKKDDDSNRQPTLDAIFGPARTKVADSLMVDRSDDEGEEISGDE